MSEPAKSQRKEGKSFLDDSQGQLLANRVLVLFDEFLDSDLWKQSLENFKEKGFKTKLVKKLPILGTKEIEIDYGKFLNPQLIDRVILEMKDAAYQYCMKNPQKAREFIQLLEDKLRKLLE
jgi:hypothetical protein